jgi:glutathione synthase/RimK-type ligase-like ATP-grasp enzyme
MSRSDLNAGVKRLFWVFPDRNTDAQQEQEFRRVWSVYAEILREDGIEFALVKPDDIHFDCTGDRSCCFVQGEICSPADTIFVTVIWAMPHQVIDVCNQMFLYSTLEAFGFYLPIPPQIAYVSEDKLATYLHLSGCPARPIPSRRIAAGRDSYTKNYRWATSNIEYPVLVKPAHWSLGIGVCIAENAEHLHGLIGLARGAETPLIIQPFIDHAIDNRVYVIDGKPKLLLKRTPAAGAMTANLASGGRAEWTDEIPDALVESINYIYQRMPIPFLAMDFLFDGERYWLSEIEPDGALVFDDEDAHLRARQVAAARARFRAYCEGHRAFMKGRAE